MVCVPPAEIGGRGKTTRFESALPRRVHPVLLILRLIPQKRVAIALK